MKIGFLSQAASSGHTYVNKQFERAFAEEHEVAHLIFGGAKENDYQYAVDLFERPSVIDTPFLQMSVEDYDHIKEWIDKEGIDALFCNEVEDWNLLSELKKDVKLIGYIVMDRIQVGTIPLYERIFDLTYICNERGYEIFSAQKNCQFVPWGVDTEQFKPRGEADTYFVHSAGWGGTDYRKCTPETVRNWYQTDSTLTLATQAKVYDHRTAEIVREQRGNRLNLIFSAKKPEEIYEKGKVYIGLSKHEGLGLYLPEALASGLPVITTDASPMNQFVEDQKTGLLVSYDNTFTRKDFELQGVIPKEDEIFENLQWAVENPDKMEEMGKNAREFALENHSMELFTKHVNKALNHV